MAALFSDAGVFDMVQFIVADGLIRLTARGAGERPNRVTAPVKFRFSPSCGLIDHRFIQDSPRVSEWRWSKADNTWIRYVQPTAKNSLEELAQHEFASHKQKESELWERGLWCYGGRWHWTPRRWDALTYEDQVFELAEMAATWSGRDARWICEQAILDEDDDERLSPRDYKAEQRKIERAKKPRPNVKPAPTDCFNRTADDIAIWAALCKVPRQKGRDKLATCAGCDKAIPRRDLPARFNGHPDDKGRWPGVLCRKCERPGHPNLSNRRADHPIAFGHEESGEDGYDGGSSEDEFISGDLVEDVQAGADSPFSLQIRKSRDLGFYKWPPPPTRCPNHGAIVGGPRPPKPWIDQVHRWPQGVSRHDWAYEQYCRAYVRQMSLRPAQKPQKHLELAILRGLEYAHKEDPRRILAVLKRPAGLIPIFGVSGGRSFSRHRIAMIPCRRPWYYRATSCKDIGPVNGFGYCPICHETGTLGKKLVSKQKCNPPKGTVKPEETMRIPTGRVRQHHRAKIVLSKLADLEFRDVWVKNGTALRKRWRVPKRQWNELVKRPKIRAALLDFFRFQEFSSLAKNKVSKPLRYWTEAFPVWQRAYVKREAAEARRDQKRRKHASLKYRETASVILPCASGKSTLFLSDGRVRNESA
jgi:hypothetical protein